jgi:chemotaxis protein MotB
MEDNGVRPNQVVQVRGFADRKLRKPLQPLDASNRRITLIIQYVPNATLAKVIVSNGSLPVVK